MSATHSPGPWEAATTRGRTTWIVRRNRNDASNSVDCLRNKAGRVLRFRSEAAALAAAASASHQPTQEQNNHG